MERRRRLILIARRGQIGPSEVDAAAQEIVGAAPVAKGSIIPIAAISNRRLLAGMWASVRVRVYLLGRGQEKKTRPLETRPGTLQWPPSRN